MNDILSFNQGLFGTIFRERRASRRVRKEMVQSLVIPDCAVEMTYDDMQQTDGGKTVGINLSITLSAGFALSLVTSTAAKAALTVYLTANLTAAGAAVGGPAALVTGGLSAFIAVAGVGFIVSKLTNLIASSLIDGPSQTYTVHLFDMFIPFRKKDITLSLGGSGL